MEKRGYGGRPQRGGATDRGARPSPGDDAEEALGPPGEAGTGGNQGRGVGGSGGGRGEEEEEGGRGGRPQWGGATAAGRKASNMHDNNINNT